MRPRVNVICIKFKTDVYSNVWQIKPTKILLWSILTTPERFDCSSKSGSNFMVMINFLMGLDNKLDIAVKKYTKFSDPFLQ